MLTRQNRKPPEGAISTTVSMTEAMRERIRDEAAREGHYNFSGYIVTVLAEHFEKLDKERAAA